MRNRPPYPCTGCKEIFDSYDEYDEHRSTVHGRRADGTLLRPDGTPYPPYAATPTMELRVAALERTVERLVAEMERMQQGEQP